MNMRIVLAGTGLLLLSGCAAAPTFVPPSASRPTLVDLTTDENTIWGAGTPTLVSFPIDIAEDQGFFAQNHIREDRQTLTAITSAQALGTGSIDFTMYTGSAARAAMRGLPIRVVSFQSTGGWSLLGQKDITSVQQLRGAPIGVSSIGSDETNYLGAALQTGGMSITDVAQLALSSESNIVAALESGQVRAAVLVAPNTEREKANGYTLLATPAVGYFPGGGLATSLKDLQDRPQVVRAALKSLLQAIAWARDNPDRAIPYFAAKYHIDPALAQEAYQNQLKVTRLNFSDEDLANFIKRTADESDAPVVPVSQVFDFSIYRTLVAEVGLDKP